MTIVDTTAPRQPGAALLAGRAAPTKGETNQMDDSELERKIREVFEKTRRESPTLPLSAPGHCCMTEIIIRCGCAEGFKAISGQTKEPDRSGNLVHEFLKAQDTVSCPELCPEAPAAAMGERVDMVQLSPEVSAAVDRAVEATGHSREDVVKSLSEAVKQAAREHLAALSRAADESEGSEGEDTRSTP